MATVTLSAALCNGIVANATRPFSVALGEALGALRNDPELMHCARAHLSDKDTAVMAEELYRRNPAWTHNMQVSLTLIDVDGTAFALDAVGPLPINGYNQAKIELAKTPNAAIQTRLAHLRIPYDRAVHDKNALTSSLTNIFSECTTLQHVIEVMPSVNDWIPNGENDTYRARMAAAPPKRNEKRRSAADIRADSLSNDAVIAIARAKTTNQ